MTEHNHNSNWKSEARDMRRRGFSFREIAEKFGKTVKLAEATCRGIKVGEAQPSGCSRLMDEFGIRIMQKPGFAGSRWGGQPREVMISLPLLSIMVEGNRG